jgi:O-antigen/teichoic acid export membrane protein
MQESLSGRSRLQWLGNRQAMQHSVIRRSLYVVLFFVAGHGFYYLLVLAANARLDPVGFGRFYLGWAMLNILFAPGAVLTLSLSGHFAEAFRQNGTAGIRPALWSVGANMLPWALALLVGLEVLLLLGGRLVGADSALMIAVLPLTALSSVMVDSVRAMLQGALRFVSFGASWLLWCIVQFVAGTAALVFIGEPWAVFLGMFLANCVAFACLLAAVWRLGGIAAANTDGTTVQSDFPSLQNMVPFCLTLGAFVILSNADVLVAYFKLNGVELGMYAASAVLPKAIVTATQPVAQVILPVATSIRGDSLKIREALLKALGMTFVLAGVGAIALLLVSGEACGGRFGIKFCDSWLMLLLTSAAVAISVTRTAVVADVLGGRLWRPLLSAVALIAFAAANWPGHSTGTALAASYSVICWLLLGTLVAAKLVEWRRVGGGPSLKRAFKR